MSRRIKKAGSWAARMTAVLSVVLVGAVLTAETAMAGPKHKHWGGYAYYSAPAAPRFVHRVPRPFHAPPRMVYAPPRVYYVPPPVVYVRPRPVPIYPIVPSISIVIPLRF